jgi:hypothetical protein
MVVLHFQGIMKFYDAIIQAIVRHINFDSKCAGYI